MTELIVVCGAPGAGKSTAVRNALQTHMRAEMPRDSFPRREAVFTRGGTLAAVELGTASAAFPGTDTLPMNIIGSAVEYLRAAPEQPPVIIAEGARLSNRRFLQAGLDAGMGVTLLHLDNPHAAAWRQARAGLLGKTQNPAWAKGRDTAARNLAADPPEGVRVKVVQDPDLATLIITSIINERTPNP